MQKEKIQKILDVGLCLCMFLLIGLGIVYLCFGVALFDISRNYNVLVVSPEQLQAIMIACAASLFLNGILSLGAAVIGIPDRWIKSWKDKLKTALRGTSKC